MFRVIVSIVFLVLIAVLIVLNIGNASTFNFYGFSFPDVPVIVVAILSFVAGVLYSFLFYAIRFLDRKRRERLKERVRRALEAGAPAQAGHYREREAREEGKVARKTEAETAPPEGEGDVPPAGRESTGSSRRSSHGKPPLAGLVSRARKILRPPRQ
jgi:uncharacterized integral membrane protein